MENRDPSQPLLTVRYRRVASLGRFIAVTMTNDGSGGKCVTAAAPLWRAGAAAVTYCARIMEIERRKTDGGLLIIGKRRRR